MKNTIYIHKTNVWSNVIISDEQQVWKKEKNKSQANDKEFSNNQLSTNQATRDWKVNNQSIVCMSC